MARGEGSVKEAVEEIGVDEEKRAGRGMVTAALMLAMTVAALEQTVVSTAMPTIIARLRGLEIYPWVFSAYLLAATVTTPLYGKLADLLGRKRVLLFGLGLFSLGSMLSGLASSMPMLIAMRVVQGIGAGAVMPIVLTLVGDLYSLEERAKVQGLFSGIWGTASVIGPALGGVLTDRLSWRWVFFVTVPFSLVSAWVLMVAVKEDLEKKAIPPIDWAGAALLTGGTSALLLAVLGGEDRPWVLSVGLLGIAVGLLVLFVRQERRAADPILPLDLLTQPTIAASVAGSFLIGALLFGLDTYVPLYVQGVLGGTATRAGRMMTPLFLAWATSAAVAARLVVRLGFRVTAQVGSLLVVAGTLALGLGSIWRGAEVPAFASGMVLIGLGLGPTSLSYILGVQNAVLWERRGVATGAVTFSRTIGGALGVGLLGAVLGLELVHRLAATGTAGLDVAAALRPETHAHLAPEQLLAVREALRLALRDVFLQMLALAGLGLACAAGLPRARSASPVDLAEEFALAASEM